ncbi:Calcium-binding EF-hand [Corchorus capsularis]|uniref:Calcium-binding EF-hand n=1 Tax=Corchorus capsularis TaxID=210143 RepID=A0A1R3G8Q3_COCAP|nr:Calcium-binding EF-hand [Corchorus capsularis]
MGNYSSMLTQYDIEEVQEYCNNLFSQQEIVSLYQRFCQLDRNAKGFISADEFLSVPEFAMNPLSQRLLKMVDGLNFKDFVAFLSAFSAKASTQQKVQLIFKVYDSDGNGKVSFNDILEVLRDLSGSFMSDDQREQVLTQLLKEAGFLNFMLAYFIESVLPLILEPSESKTQNLNSSIQLLRGIRRKKTELVSCNIKADVSADSVLKRENMSSQFRNEEGASSSSKDEMEKSRVMSHSGSNKGKVDNLQAGEAEQLSRILKNLEEENEMMKQALLETVMERKELVNEICQLFNTLCYNLHCKDGEVGNRSRHG